MACLTCGPGGLDFLNPVLCGLCLQIHKLVCETVTCVTTLLSVGVIFKNHL